MNEVPSPNLERLSQIPTSWTKVHDKNVTWFAEVYRQALINTAVQSFRLAREEAEELVQSFFVKRVLSDHGVLHGALQEKGQFRGFLARSLRNFWIDRLRLEKRAPTRSAANLGEVAADDRSIEDVSAREWADQFWGLFRAAVQRACLARNLERTWAVIELMYFQAPGTTHQEAMERLKLRSVHQVAHALRPARAVLDEAIRDVLKDDPDLIAEVLSDLRTIAEAVARGADSFSS